MSQTKRAKRTVPKAGKTERRDASHFPTDESTGFLVRAANRALQRALEERITPRGVTPGQWYFLRVLWEEDGLNQRELSNLVGMTEPTTVVALNSMERAKLIRRVRSETDKRKVHIFLTQKGKRLRSVMMPLAREVNEIATKGVPAEDMAALRRALGQILDNIKTNGD